MISELCRHWEFLSGTPESSLGFERHGSVHTLWLVLWLVPSMPEWSCHPGIGRGGRALWEAAPRFPGPVGVQQFSSLIQRGSDGGKWQPACSGTRLRSHLAPGGKALSLQELLLMADSTEMSGPGGTKSRAGVGEDQANRQLPAVPGKLALGSVCGQASCVCPDPAPQPCPSLCTWVGPYSSLGAEGPCKGSRHWSRAGPWLLQPPPGRATCSGHHSWGARGFSGSDSHSVPCKL